MGQEVRWAPHGVRCDKASSTQQASLLSWKLQGKLQAKPFKRPTNLD
jgi:hypothetical protein